MKFFWKVFISVFITILSVGMLLVATSYRFMNHWTTKEYIARYSSFSKVLGDALGNLDVNTEALMHNAARIVADLDDKEGPLSTQKLLELRDSLNVTHIFVINKKGDFIRSTNEDPKLIPNAFSFCGEYRNLFSGKAKMVATPILHPNPEVKPFKFLFLETKNRQRLIEVGVRVDFVAQTLTKAIGADPNLISVSLYSPIGEVFGRFSAKGVEFGNGRIKVPTEFPQLIEDENVIRYFMKLPSSHPQCCQCEVTGTSRNGEYYYVLESKISKRGLKELQASMQTVFLILIISTVFLAFVLSRYISRRLVANIEKADKRLKLIMAEGPTKRLGMTGEDEIVFLTKQFDRLLDQLEESQNKIVESEKLKAKVQLAREVAHNIKSPTIAIEMIMPLLHGMPGNVKKILFDSAKDIRRLTDRLLRQADVDDKHSMALTAPMEPIRLKDFLEDLVNTKNLEHGDGKSAFVILRISEDFGRSTISADPTELKAVISNLINNALESYSTDPTVIHVSGECGDQGCIVSVADRGRGIPPEILSKIGCEEVTFGKDEGQGIGLLHAFRVVESWGGNIKIESTVGEGTAVRVIFPCEAHSDLQGLDQEAQQ